MSLIELGAVQSANSTTGEGLMARAISAVRVNVVNRSDRGFWVKRRRFGMSWVIRAGNLFLRWSKCRARMYPSASAWLDREIEVLCALHGSGAAWRENKLTLVTKEIQGETLRDLFARGAMNAEILWAAGVELGRLHEIRSRSTGGKYSHGDPHTGNILYDERTRRASLIDIETTHEPGMPDDERAADDLLVLLLDLIGRGDANISTEYCEGVIRGYCAVTPEASRVLKALHQRLYEYLTSSGFLERVLWSTRTGFLGPRELAPRLEQLGEIVSSFERLNEGSKSVPCEVSRRGVGC